MAKPHITREMIEQCLRGLGLQAGDIVLLHSSLSSMGHVESAAKTVADAFLAVLGRHGTLVVPAFGALGAVSDYVKEHADAVRSVHPLASVAAIGPAAAEICTDHDKVETAHGEGTPYLRIADLGGYVCLLGVDQDRNTSLHAAEVLLRLPYLSDRTEKFDTPEGPVEKTFRFFPGPHRDFIALDPILRERGIVRIGHIGRAVVRLMRSREMLDACLDLGRADPAFVLCGNPNCSDCVAQRAAIRRDRLAREPFTLVAASGLAGWGVAEVCEATKAAGIEALELDQIQGLPIHLVPSDQFRAAVEMIRASDLHLSALRLRGIPEGLADVMDRAATNAIERIVLPLSPQAEAHARLASDRGLKLSLVNVGVGGQTASEAMLGLRAAGYEVGFTFNPASFALVGEKPFLSSYRQKLREFVDQLDLEDATHDGTVQPLGHGNAEVKEMISMLRCASFEGTFVLTAANREMGGVRGAAARFERLLDAM